MLTLPWTGATVCEADWHWAVGIWEGEGSVGLYRRRGGRAGHVDARIELTSTDRDMLAEWQSAMDLGCVGSMQRHKDTNHKPFWRVWESRRPIVGAWCSMAIPYIRTERKRQQAQDALAAISDLSPVNGYVRVGKLYGRQQLRQPPQCWKGLASLDFSVGGGPGMA